jgi:hypothetical protein
MIQKYECERFPNESQPILVATKHVKRQRSYHLKIRNRVFRLHKLIPNPNVCDITSLYKASAAIECDLVRLRRMLHITRLVDKYVICRLAGAWSEDTPNMSRLPRELGFPRNLGSASASPRRHLGSRVNPLRFLEIPAPSGSRDIFGVSPSQPRLAGR